jgi:acyl-coenzyme A synthetase/AMP-(fatty) acid ligase
VAALPSVERVVIVEYTRRDCDLGAIPKAVSYERFIGAHAPAEIAFTRVAFDHPLFILYSSGTTGLPKCNWPPGQTGDVRVVLFVKLRPELTLDSNLVENIKRQIRQNTTPRHVPAEVLQVEDIPRTKSGKIVELAVRNVVHGRPVTNVESLANPEALEHFRNRSELAT